MAGRNLTIRWKAPSSEAYEDRDMKYENIRYYLMEHNVPGTDSPIELSATALSYEFENVPIGEYFISIIVVDKYDNRSIPFTRQITVANDFAAEIPRLPLNVPVGGFSNAEPMITSTGIYRFKKTNYTLVPKHPKAKHTNSNSLEQSVYSQDVSTIAGIASIPARDGQNFTATIEDFHYILHQPDEALDKMKLVRYHEKEPSGFRDSIPRWYDAGSGSQSNEDDFVTLTGTCIRDYNSSQITGDGTSFLSEVKVGDIIKGPVTKRIAFYPQTGTGDVNTADSSISIDSSNFPIPSGTTAVYEGDALGSLVDGGTYYVESVTGSQDADDEFKIRLHTTKAGAIAGTSGTRKTLSVLNELTDGDMKYLNLTTDKETYLGTVNYVVSDTEIHLDNFENNYTFAGTGLKRSGLRINRISDTIIAEIAKLTNGSYYLNNLLEKDGATEVDVPPTHEDGGLAHYYPLNTVVNGNVTDAKGSSTPSILGTGFSVSDNSIMGRSIDLSGGTAIKLLTDSEADAFMSTGNWSISIWAKSEKNDASDDSDSIEQARLISRDRDKYFALMYAQNASQTISLDYRSSNGGMERIVLHDAPAFDEWHHFAVTAEGQTLKVYADGLYIGSVTDYLPNTADARPLAIGADVEGTVQNTTTGRTFHGKVTEVNLYKKTLTEGEVQGLYALPGAGNNTVVQDNITVIGGGDEAITVDSSGLYLGAITFENAPFSVSPAGAIKASSGQIAGWNLSSASIKSGDQADTTTYTASGITLSSDGSIHSPEFYITEADGANFKGTLAADKGNVGGWELKTGTIVGKKLSDNQQLRESDSAAILARIESPAGFIEGMSDVGNAIILHSQGSLHSKNFYINSNGESYFSGNISGASGEFSGGIGEGTISGSVLQEGTVTGSVIAPGTIQGSNISHSTKLEVYSLNAQNNVIPSSYAALDGENDVYRLYAGSNAASAAPFRVTKEGKLVATNLQLFDNNDTLYFDSTTGFTPAALTQIARSLSGRLKNYSEPFSGDIDATDTATFEKIILTDSSSLRTKLRIPTSSLSFTASAEFYGTTSNMIYYDIDFATATLNAAGSATNTVTHTVASPDFKKPDGSSLDRLPFEGEIIVVRLINLPENIVAGSITGALNASPTTPVAWPSTTTITGPAASKQLIFKLNDDSATFSVTLDSTSYSNIVISSAVDPTPNTETTARSKIPTQIVTGLKVRSPAIDSSDSDAIAATTFTSETTEASLTSSKYYVKTLLKDGVGYGHIQSTVAVVPFSGSAVDDQGYITISSPDSGTTAAETYYYHSTLNITGGDSSLYPTKRVFEASVVGASDVGFLVSSTGQITQDLQSDSLSGLDLQGNLLVPDGFTIDPPQTSDTIVIDGNLQVNGTQTNVNQSDLTLTNKTVTLSDGATDASNVDDAGIVVDRSSLSGNPTDATILWDNDNSYWDFFGGVQTGLLKFDRDGEASSPLIKFGASGSGVYFGADTDSHDVLYINTQNSSDEDKVTSISQAGITSSNNVYTATAGTFGNPTGTWKATSGSQDLDFEFVGNDGTNDTAIFKIDKGTSSATLQAYDVAEPNPTVLTLDGHGNTRRDGTLKIQASQPGIEFQAGVSEATAYHTLTFKNTGQGWSEMIANNGGFGFIYGTASKEYAAPTADVLITPQGAGSDGAYAVVSIRARETNSGLGYAVDHTQSTLNLHQTKARTNQHDNFANATSISFSQQQDAGNDTEVTVTRAAISVAGTDPERGYGYMHFHTYGNEGEIGKDTSNASQNLFPRMSIDYLGRMALNTDGKYFDHALRVEPNNLYDDYNADSILSIGRDGPGDETGDMGRISFRHRVEDTSTYYTRGEIRSFAYSGGGANLRFVTGTNLTGSVRTSMVLESSGNLRLGTQTGSGQSRSRNISMDRHNIHTMQHSALTYTAIDQSYQQRHAIGTSSTLSGTRRVVSAKYHIFVKSTAGQTQCSELLVMYDGTNIDMVEYAVLVSGTQNGQSRLLDFEAHTTTVNNIDSFNIYATKPAGVSGDATLNLIIRMEETVDIS